VADDEWYDLAEPLLEYIHANAPKMGSMNVGAIADALQRDPQAVAKQIDKLHGAQFLTGGVYWPGGRDPRQATVNSPGLAERGLRVVGAWPTDDPYEALIELLDRQIESASDDQTKTKLATLKDTLATVGKSTVASLLVALASGGVHGL
jgi:hypothetical protein